VGDEIRAPDTLVDATLHATADAGSIPAVSTVRVSRENALETVVRINT
jgi:hypothetical protein